MEPEDLADLYILASTAFAGTSLLLAGFIWAVQ